MHDNDSNITAIRTLLPKRREHLTGAATFPRNPRRLERRDVAAHAISESPRFFAGNSRRPLEETISTIR